MSRWFGERCQCEYIFRFIRSWCNRIQFFDLGLQPPPTICFDHLFNPPLPYTPSCLQHGTASPCPLLLSFSVHDSLVGSLELSRFTPLGLFIDNCKIKLPCNGLTIWHLFFAKSLETLLRCYCYNEDVINKYSWRGGSVFFEMLWIIK